MAKKYTRSLLSVIIGTLIAGVHLSAQVLTQPSPNFPPPPGKYIDYGRYSQQYRNFQVYANGVIIRGFMNWKFTQSQPPPPPGGTQIYTFNSEVDMQISIDSGTTFNPVVAVNVGNSVKVTSVPAEDIGNSRAFDTEVLSLNIQGGGFPLGFMIRESPTLQSTGKTRITADPGGDYRISSFFDIFTEISLDGGATWPAAVNGAGHVILLGDSIPPVVATHPKFPPMPIHYRGREAYNQIYPDSVVITAMSLEEFTVNYPPPDSSQNDTFSSTVKMEISADGGQTFQGYTAPGDILMHVQRNGGGTGNTGTFDTEMLSLDITGGNLPAGMMIRESPTKASLGSTTITQGIDGSYRIDSFFDIFTEVSLDGGATWNPTTNGSTNMIARPKPPPIVSQHDSLPPIPGHYVTPSINFQVYPNGIVLKDVSLEHFLHFDPPPPPDSTRNHSFGLTVKMSLSTDGGATFQSDSVQANANLQASSILQIGQERFFDTEMLQLDIAGGTLPAGVMIRESPTKASIGETTIIDDPGPQFRMSSFFDVFTEVSLDSGASWTPANEPAQIEFRPDSSQSTQYYNFLTGWNMVSVPFTTNDYRKSVLFPSAVSSAFLYESGHYDLAGDTLANRIGYWLKFSGAHTDSIDGYARMRDTINVAKGWNIVGSISEGIPTSAITSNPPGIVTSNFYGYTGNYVIADSILPGKAYWVMVNQNGALILASSSSMASEAGRIKIVATKDLPPAPPDGHEIKIPIPTSYSLGQNYPNPFNPSTIISYAIVQPSKVRLSMFNILGQEVITLINRFEDPGYKSVSFDASKLPSGVYYYRLQAGNFTAIKKMLLIK